MLALLPAFLAEIGFYLMPGFDALRRWFDGIGTKGFRAFLLVASAVTPYCLESLRLASFRFTSLLLLTSVATLAAFWYVWMRPGPLVDALFLTLMAAVFLSQAFTLIFVRPLPHLQIEILGKLMWIRLGIMSVLSLRRIENIRFGFVPTSSEWRIGIEQYLYFLPVGALVVYLVRFAHFHLAPITWWKFPIFAAGTFAGIFWVVALGEEFFFRGFLQPLLARGLHSEVAGLVTTSTLFGAAHLPAHPFPNWRFAAVAAVTGVFYGIAFLRARSIRACMVTHALVVTTWRCFLSS